MTRYFRFPSFSFHNTAHKITIALIAASIVEALSGFSLLSFIPRRVLSGEIWRPFTSLFVAAGPMEIIFGGLIIYSIGGELESRWGKKRFIRVALGIPLVAQAITLAIGLIFGTASVDAIYPGARQVITCIWIVYGLMFWLRGNGLNFWGTPITGKTFALIGLGFVVLGAVYQGIRAVLPELLSAALSYGYMYRHSLPNIRRKAELSYFNWKLKRLKSKKGLHIVKRSDSDLDDEPGSQIH